MGDRAEAGQRGSLGKGAGLYGCPLQLEREQQPLPRRTAVVVIVFLRLIYKG